MLFRKTFNKIFPARTIRRKIAKAIYLLFFDWNKFKKNLKTFFHLWKQGGFRAVFPNFEKFLLLTKLAFKFVRRPMPFLRNLNLRKVRTFLLYLKTTNASVFEKKVDRILQTYGPNPEDLEQIVRQRFTGLRPLLAYHTPRTGLRLNMVTDSINRGSLFGGVATAIILSALLSDRWGCDLRIITRTEKADEGNFGLILKGNGVPFYRSVDFLFSHYDDVQAEVAVGERDVFLTTSWWTTLGVTEVFGHKKVIYLLQEDERIFYPFGDDHARCTHVLNSPRLQFIINTKLLYDHLVSHGFENIRGHGLWFEPSWPQSLFFLEHFELKKKKSFFFYARPNNPRNLFYLGLEAINIAVTRGVLNLNEWEIYCVGKDIPPLCIGGTYRPHIYQSLNWVDYAALVRKMDLGLCLAYSSHPSYPPLDLAASGAVAITNRYGNKQNLDDYSKNIFCCELDIDSLVQGIKNGVELATNYDERVNNYTENRILRDWKTSFEDVLRRLERWPS